MTISKDDNPKNNNHFISVDKYLVEHAQQKVKDQNGGKRVKPVLVKHQPKLESSEKE